MFQIQSFRRTPTEKAQVAAAFAARVAARRDDRVMQASQYGATVFYAFLDGRFVRGDAQSVMTEIERFDRRDEPVTVRITGRLAASYEQRGVYRELNAGSNEIRYALAGELQIDATRALELTEDQAERAAYRALLRQLAEILA